MANNKLDIVLASTSPRRIGLLAEIGIKSRVVAPTADEQPKRGEKPRDLVTRLAREKAESVLPGASRGKKGVIIIAADTIVVSPNGKRILGKPRDRAEAVSMLRSLAGREHTVFTGYCILAATRTDWGARVHEIVRAVESKVRMRTLSAADILAYVATGEPMDKAGAYAAQGKGMALIEEIRGSYTNVVGLPVCQVATDLELQFGVPLFGRKKRR